MIYPYLDGLSVLLSLLPVHLERWRREEDDVGLEIGVVEDGERGRLFEGAQIFYKLTKYMQRPALPNKIGRVRKDVMGTPEMTRHNNFRT